MKEKKSSSKDARGSQAAGDNQGDDNKEQPFSGGTVLDAKSSEGSKSWQEVGTYGTGSASRASAVTELSPKERSPALKSPLQSVVVRRRSPRPSPLQKPSPTSSNPTQLGSTLQSSSSFQSGSHQFEHNLTGLSPTRKSPVCKSPTTISSIYGASQKEEIGAAFSKRQVVLIHGINLLMFDCDIVWYLGKLTLSELNVETHHILWDIYCENTKEQA